MEQPRSTQRKKKKAKPDEEALRAAIIKLAKDYGRYGYRRITALLNQDGWRVNHKRVERIWREEGLKVTKKQPKRKRLWLNDGRGEHSDCVDFEINGEVVKAAGW